MAKNPINKSSMKKLFDTVSPMGADAAEKFVRELLKAGDERRRDAEKIIAEVVAASRHSAEHLGCILFFRHRPILQSCGHCC